MVAINLPAPHRSQNRVLAECSRFNALECGRRWGKTTFGLGMAAEFASRGMRVAWIVPSYKYFAEAWDEILELLGTLVKHKSKSDGRIKLHTGGVIDLWSTHNNPDVCRGRKYHIVIFDEAALIDGLVSIWDNAVRPSLSDYEGEAWFLSTPAGFNDFHQLFERGQQGDPEWASWRLGTADNPFIKRREIASAKRSMPRTAFEQEYLGIPAPDAGNPFDLRKIAAGVAALSTRPPACFGVDIALSLDFTVVIGLDDRGSVCHFERYQGTDYEEITPRIARAIQSRPALVDATGVGKPVVDRLRKDLGCLGVEPFVFTGPSKQALMEELVYSIHNTELRYPDGDITRELRTFRYELGRGGRVRYSAPSGLHDDCVCALALANRLKTNYVVPGVTFTGGMAEDDEAGADHFGDWGRHGRGAPDIWGMECLRRAA